MATITKRGDTYRIRCSLGYDSKGKQVVRSTTWKPEPGMSEKQVQKELNRFAVLFEEKCRNGGGDPHITFEKFAEKWLTEYADTHLKAIIHHLRNSSKYVSYKDLKALMTDLKAVYAAVDEQAALDALDAFSEHWDKKYRVNPKFCVKSI